MIIDITQEIFSCRVYPDHPAPERKLLMSIENGDECNLTALFLCVHNGTHLDAPRHFIRDGKTIDQIPLDVFVGPCWVERHKGDVTQEDAHRILEKAAAAQAASRILIAGPATVTMEAAEVFAEAGILLIGNESQTVGPEDNSTPVHKLLLGQGCILLEGLVMDSVEEGPYTLHAVPLNLAGSDGSPTRVYLIR